MDSTEDRWASLRVWIAILGNIGPWVWPLSLANPKSHRGVQNVLIESVLWLSEHSHALLSPMDLARPMLWSVGRSGSHFMQCTQPSWSCPIFQVSTYFGPNSSVKRCCPILGWIRYDGIGLPNTHQSIGLLILTCLYLVACPTSYLHVHAMFHLLYKFMPEGYVMFHAICIYVYQLMQVSCSK